MPKCAWTCIACAQSNSPASDACSACQCLASPTVAQIETAREGVVGNTGAAREAAESRGQQRVGILILLTVVGAVAGWVGSRWIFHTESLTFALWGAILVLIASFARRFRGRG